MTMQENLSGINKPMKLGRDYFLDTNVTGLARSLLGKVLASRIGNKITSGIITETEAYAGITDKASHAYGGRFTKRTAVMYKTGGTAYIYLCYGVHSLFNVVTAPIGTPHAVLIRSVVPLEGIGIMLSRRGLQKPDPSAFIGPGKVAKALGLHFSMSGIDLTGNKIWLEDRSIRVASDAITAHPRIGVGYAGDHALLPWRFAIENIDNFTEWKFLK